MKKRSNRPPSQRQLRVGEELRHVLAQVIEREDLHDPDLDGVSITVSEVRISPDLSNATVFVTRLGGGKAEETVAALQRATPFLRHQIAQRVQLRRVPNLKFQADTSFDYAEHIGQILEDVNPDQLPREGFSGAGSENRLGEED
ncbi:MAG: 30S ribosome-binding factor RbfA [Rhodospirillales bacterium]